MNSKPTSTDRQLSFWKRITRVSISGLLVMVTVVSVVIASESNRVRNVQFIIENIDEDRLICEVRHPIFETELWDWTKIRFGKHWNQDLTSISSYNFKKPANPELLKRIMRLKHLRNLNISGTTLTESQIRGLGKLKSLQWLSFNGTNVSMEQVRKLRKQLPNTFVTCLNTESL